MTYGVEHARLPLAGLTQLASEARDEGFAFLNRLIADWGDESNCFDREGERLMSIHVDGELIAIGGLNIDPYGDSDRVGRLRRFYVKPSHRRGGVGHRLIGALLEGAEEHFDIIRLRTNNPDAMAFYEAYGFERVGLENVTHSLALAD